MSNATQAIIREAAAALDSQREGAVIPRLEATARQEDSNPALWQWLGLLHRATDNREAAIPAFERAAALAPGDAKIAHGLARVLLEAGLPAVEAFERAVVAAPGDGDARLGLVAARFAGGDGDAALTELDALLRANPLWQDGHRDRIKLAWLLGRGGQAFAVWRDALTQHGKDGGLWQVGIQTGIDAGMYEAALRDVAAARKMTGGAPLFDLNEAVALSELGRVREADEAFRLTEAFDLAPLALHRVRHALRNDRLVVATRILDSWLGKEGAEGLWPYADILWRLTGDARAEWLNPDDHIRVIDLADRIADLNALAACLRSLHLTRNAHLDQSVRGGTQTDGVLFSRIEPEIRALRSVVQSAVSDYVAALPARDDTHPLLAPRRDHAPRFAGSWSVRLAGAGFHANHVHPQGWISSALYVALPEQTPADPPNAGWLALGCPQAELGLALPATRLIEPMPGRLVLFPSTLWHGTLPFAQGERLTVAFDVARRLA